jgi:hypothetical protein
MKLGVVGNCQALGFAACLEALVPGAEVVVEEVGGGRDPARSTPEALERRAEDLAGCDIVFSHLVASNLGPLGTEALAARVRRLMRLPLYAFDGFQPDCIYVRETDGRNVEAAVGPYHSALVLACFLEKLPPERAARLFNPYVFAALGYFDAHALAVQALTRRWAEEGFDLAEALAGCPPVFMLTPNHPRIEALCGLARQALRKADIHPAGSITLPPDGLARSRVWPVYPAIAQRLGVEGSLGFQQQRGIMVDLPEMIARAYAAYAGLRSLRPSPQITRAWAFMRTEVRGLPPHPLWARAGLEDVRAAHRMILGRDCASDQQAQAMAAAGMLVGDLRMAMLRSDEFRNAYKAIG